MDTGVAGRSMLTVACVLSEGPKRTYDRSHVARLAFMVAGHLDSPYRFVCLDDSPFPGWWAKISLFEPGRFKGRVLYLDLDVTVVGGLGLIARYPASFVAIRDYIKLGFNSSVMSWDAGAVDHLYTEFTSDVMDRMHGDQDWITARMSGREAAMFPRKWCVSYRASVEPTGRVPTGAKIVVFHGSPKPWEVPAVA